MPRVEPTEGFADDVMAALQRGKAKGASTHQPFAQSGVIGPTGSDIRVRAPSKPITARTPSGPMWGRQDMSKRGYWIMGGVAAAVLALFVGTSVDFPASGDKAEYRRQLARVREAVEDLCRVGGRAGKLTLGDQVQHVEEEAQRYLGVKHALLLTNATAGFEIAYKMAGLRPGDEVIVPAITFIATIVYPLALGAKVVLADVDRRTINMDPADVARKVTDRTKAIIPVHIGGYPVDMDPIMQIARERDIVVIEEGTTADNGDNINIGSFEGEDVFNFGNDDSNTIFPFAVGARYRVTDNFILGTAYELPLDHKDITQQRVYVDAVLHF